MAFRKGNRVKKRERHKTLFHKRLFTNEWNGVLQLKLQTRNGTENYDGYVEVFGEISGNGESVMVCDGIFRDEAELRRNARQAREIGEAILEYAEAMETFDWEAFRAAFAKKPKAAAKAKTPKKKAAKE